MGKYLGWILRLDGSRGVLKSVVDRCGAVLGSVDDRRCGATEEALSNPHQSRKVARPIVRRGVGETELA